MIEVKITPQKAMTGTMETVLNAVCGALAGEDFRFIVTQVDDTTLHVQATDEKGDEVF
jgi:hypothetical protein